MKRRFTYQGQALDTSQTILCGIVNATPDSFSDGGLYYEEDRAVAQGLALIEAGARMLDIGGESTRPGSTPVGWEEELDRVQGVIRRLRQETDLPLSIDTWKSQVARGALEAGANIVNDISGLCGDPAMKEVVAQAGAGLVLMNNPIIYRPDHPSARIFPSFGASPFSPQEEEEIRGLGIVEAMHFFFDKMLDQAQAAGIQKEQIMLDPGIGFGLTKKENLLLLKEVASLHEAGYTAFVGVSRKRFINNLLEEAGYPMEGAGERTGHALKDLGSAALTALCARAGIEVLRVHNVQAHRPAQIIGDAVRLAEESEDLNFGAYASKQ